MAPHGNQGKVPHVPIPRLRSFRWSLVIAFAYYAIKGNTSRTVAQGGPRATEILQARFARGEISVEEYRERREDTRDRLDGQP
jgi:uncharacterized membrane protein